MLNLLPDETLSLILGRVFSDSMSVRIKLVQQRVKDLIHHLINIRYIDNFGNAKMEQRCYVIDGFTLFLRMQRKNYCFSCCGRQNNVTSCQSHHFLLLFKIVVDEGLSVVYHSQRMSWKSKLYLSSAAMLRQYDFNAIKTYF